MIKNLIQAYQTRFYDSSSAIWMSAMKHQWFLGILSLFTLILIGVLTVIAICHNQLTLMCIAVIIMLIFTIATDTYAFKQYHGTLQKEALHLENVKEFLETTYPNYSLFSEDKIDILIVRLSKYTQETQPFKTLTSKLSSFAKVIIFPIITYLAGVYSSDLVQIDFGSAMGAAVVVTTALAIIYVAWLSLSTFLRKSIYRDYDIALALYEDLQDIKLIYFTGSCAPTNE